MKALRVLVVEDDTMIGTLLVGMLQEMGHDVCAIEATEAEAVNAAAKHRPDLMIVDARLGGGSGVAAVAQILRAGFIAHIFISGNISAVKALRPGAVILEKPFGQTELAHAIGRARDAAPALAGEIA